MADTPLPSRTPSSPDWNSLERWAPRAKVAFCTLLVVVPIALAVGGVLIEPRPSICTGQDKHRPLQAEDDEVVPATLNMRKGQRTTIVFGRDLDTKRLTIPLDVVEGELIERTNPL